jgi:ketosteroid isomerase-like protein
MAPSNSEIVRTATRFLWSDTERLLELFDPDVVVDWTASQAPYAGIYKGHDEVRRAWTATEEAWDEWTTEAVELSEPDEETVVLVTHVRARGKGSGIVVDAYGASVWKLRNGLVTRATLYQDKKEALEALDRGRAID